jgi:hypothetical protein
VPHPDGQSNIQKNIYQGSYLSRVRQKKSYGMIIFLKSSFSMRIPRIKVEARSAEAVYHCMSRTVNSERCLDEAAKEVFRKQLWQIADYCGVQVLTYAIMSNHLLWNTSQGAQTSALQWGVY